jgi:hypothetical protein
LICASAEPLDAPGSAWAPPRARDPLHHQPLAIGCRPLAVGSQLSAIGHPCNFSVPDLARQYRVTAVPTLVLFHHGAPLDTIVGMVSPNALKSRLDSALANLHPASVSA